MMLKHEDPEKSQALGFRLRAMTRDGEVVLNSSGAYGLSDKMGLIKGRVIGHRDGFGFLSVEGEPKDWFIPAHQMATTLHGDIVLAKASKREGSKVEARIVRVVEARKGLIIGRLHQDDDGWYVHPNDNRITQDIAVDVNPDNITGGGEGKIVTVNITKSPSRHAIAHGDIVEVIGNHMAPGMEIEVALRNHDIPFTFSQEITDAMTQLSGEVSEADKAARKDLRDLPLVTIDGDDSRDFDDAVYCTPETAGGWRLWVAIADVSHYVGKDSALDVEASERGNSVYFPGEVIPMLPEKLSNGLCSLNPRVDRLSMVCEMLIDAQGKLIDANFYEAVIRSHMRFTYNTVNAILSTPHSATDEQKPFLTDLGNLNGLYSVLKGLRKERGVMEFEFPEVQFLFNRHRKINAIVPVVRNDAHKIIEECMVMANVATALFLEKNKANALFRAHDEPSPEKMERFHNFLKELGLKTTLTHKSTPKELSEALSTFEGHAEQEWIQMMLLRSMQQAVYQKENIGHFGLALSAYAHFTSPIRRYPDLVVHRAIKAILATKGQVVSGAHAYSEEEVDSLGEHCSMTSRRADEATRDVSDWLKCEFMEERADEVFKATIITVTNFGCFVRLDDIGVEGLVHITALGDSYFKYDDKRQALVSEKDNTRYTLGDKISVEVGSVDLEQTKIMFEIVAAETEKPAKKRRKRSRKKVATSA
jgi:ribonuclease R